MKLKVHFNFSLIPTVINSVVPSPSNLFHPITSVKTLASTASKPLARSNNTFSYFDISF